MCLCNFFPSKYGVLKKKKRWKLLLLLFDVFAASFWNKTQLPWSRDAVRLLRSKPFLRIPSFGKWCNFIGRAYTDSQCASHTLSTVRPTIAGRLWSGVKSVHVPSGLTQTVAQLCCVCYFFFFHPLPNHKWVCGTKWDGWDPWEDLSAAGGGWCGVCVCVWVAWSVRTLDAWTDTRWKGLIAHSVPVTFGERRHRPATLTAAARNRLTDGKQYPPTPAPRPSPNQMATVLQWGGGAGAQ